MKDSPDTTHGRAPKDPAEPPSFETFTLSEPVRKALRAVGYERATPIQAEAIPALLSGKDVVGEAQTGTGKTAAFVLPLLERLDLKSNAVQGLILTPTRELALQVAEAAHTYSKYMKRVSVLPIYGGQMIERQIHQLRRGAHIVVGTPGRIMDHLRRGTLELGHVGMLVLDEGDEMLRMGFIEDVEWILGHLPEPCQKALFSATMPAQIRRVAQKHLSAPVHIHIAHKTLTLPNITQVFWPVSGLNKLDALTRILEVEPIEAAIIFARTKIACSELREKLEARGFAVDALHGDMAQAARERTIRRLKNDEVDIIVATDVAARGLDIERVSHVINYDIPSDFEAYVHRIGRTGRAGREGKAILFVAPRERRLMNEIEHFTKQRITPMKLPTKADVTELRASKFKQRLHKVIESEALDAYVNLVQEAALEGSHEMKVVAAAAVRLASRDAPLEPIEETPPPIPKATPAHKPRSESQAHAKSARSQGKARTDKAMLYIDAGRTHGVRPTDVVGAIANEAKVPGNQIGPIAIDEDYTIVHVPIELAPRILDKLKRAYIKGRAMKLRFIRDQEDLEQLREAPPRKTPPRPEKRKPGRSRRK